MEYFVFFYVVESSFLIVFLETETQQTRYTSAVFYIIFYADMARRHGYSISVW